MIDQGAKRLIVAALIWSSSVLPSFATEKTLTFEDVTTVEADGDMSICEKRYGTSYKTMPSDKGKNHLITDVGHKFEIVASEIFSAKGTTVFHNTYLMMFAGESNFVDAEVWATGLKGKAKFTGTFTDGTCRGHVEFTH